MTHSRNGELDPTQHLIDLTQQLILRQAVDAEIVTLVTYARRDGATWQQIGEALCISKQAAQQYYG